MLVRSRLYILYSFILLLVLVFAGKLALTQIVRGADYSERADKQYFMPVASAFDRGTIYFKKKDGSLIAAATLQSGYTVAINPKQLADTPAAYSALKTVLPDLDEAAFMAAASKKSDPYEVIAIRVSEETGKQIQALKIRGVGIYTDKWRFYPGGTLAAQVLGFVGYNDAGDGLEGRYGLERFYDATLSRETPDLYVNFFAEVFGDFKDAVVAKNEREGDLVLTVEPGVQQFLERELAEIMGKYQGEFAGGIIMDPKTGAILAMATNPSFDPNDFKSVKNIKVYTNTNVQSDFEMGSIIKALTMAAGLDSGAVTTRTTYNDTGCMTVDKKPVCNYDLRARGPGTPMQEVLNKSLNLGVSFVSMQMGSSTMREYFLGRFGLGSTTGIDLPGEVRGLVGNLKSPRRVEYNTASFGQGIAVTPVETARALATLGNGGYVVTPHVVERVKYPIGPDKVMNYPRGSQVLATTSSETISRMLVTVVDKALAGGKVAIPTHAIAAKTGTAQVSDPSTGKYYPDRYFHSFFGYFPAYDPKFLVLLYIMQPKGVSFASETLTAPFMDIAKFLINYYEIPPDRSALSTDPKMP